MKKENRVKITHTQEQWRLINTALANSGIKNIPKYIKKELMKIDKISAGMEAISDCENCGNREQKIFWIADPSNQIIERLKAKTGIMDTSSIIAKFIINPLLLKP